ncbi:uncharacterized protein LOC122950751 [Acropora millepora]|uniref:uncharacterized protein LOC122950751 n=1 Tax=Acropora millepora TaxID=45264 RepID=UPI001CF143B6|nr:uncharacterized protein LOC122950751 [Acropora millepora]
MRSEAFVFFVIPLLTKAFHAWLQEDSYRVENGFITYGGFHPSFYHSLAVTPIAITLSEDILDCGFACIAKPKCASFNVAAKPDSRGSFLCELLETDMYYDSGKLRSNASFHHYSPPSPCIKHSCYHDSVCVPGFKENSQLCKGCHAGFVGNQCEREAFTCLFDQDLCGFTQSRNDTFDWTQNSGSTSSSGTGPSRDVSGNGN